jgi:signal transduction histidine kinase
MRVLVVEASQEDRRAIVDALIPIDDIAVQGAVADVQSAIRAIVEESPDVVVTGIELADGSGLELIERARQAPRPPKIVVVAPAPTRDDWQRHLAAGADRFVERDRELDELRSVLGTLVRPREPDDDDLRLLGRITAGVAHDLNNYLGALGVTLALLAREPGSPELPELIDQARDCAERMSRLTTAMLQYVRGETPPLVAVDLGDIVRGVLRVIDRIIPGSVTVEVQLSELARPVRGAPAELEQLVLNLAINALDAMPHGGVLTIRVQPTGATATFLEVRDTGRGIETPRPGRRTGLGRGIVRRVVARHDGAVKVVSGSSGGTVATVFLPSA